MTREEFYKLIKDPNTIHLSHIPGIKELIELYPYFTIPRQLLSKLYLNENHINTRETINKTAFYVGDRRSFYFYLYPDKVESASGKRLVRDTKSMGSYFDMIQAVELDGADTKQSLSKLAEKLKDARSKVAPSTAEKPTGDEKRTKPQEVDRKTEVTEENARKLIKEKKYREAILILNELYFINPKKSIYFADQIRFLEKALENLKK